MLKRFQKIAGTIFTVFICLSTLNGCKKNELTHPVRVTLNISLEQTNGLPSYLSLSQSAISIGSISFIGLRQQGSDIHFDTQPSTSQGTYVINAGQSAKYITYFDIPQGVYDYMNWGITLSEIDDDVYDNFIIDSNDCGLLISGIYTKLDGSKIPIYFLIDPLHKISFEANDFNGTNSISIIDGNTYDIIIELKPAEAISKISRDFFEQAAVENNEDNDYIVVSPETNLNFYQFFLFQLEETRKATVN